MDIMKKWNELYNTDWFPRAMPFAVFMLFVVLESFFQSAVYLIYIVKTITVGLILLHFRDRYTEIARTASLKDIFVAAVIGIIVFVLWINITWDFAMIGKPSANNPYALPGKEILYPVIFFRIFGSAIVVPVMEEIFWRSFFIRWIDHHDFMKTPLGTFTLRSFIISVLLFGSEHSLWLAGIMAGIFYNLLLYYRKNIFLCIISHAVTNFILALYVLATNRWMFW